MALEALRPTTLVDLVLVPGLLCDHRLWDSQTQALAAAARSRIPDLSGYDSIEAMAAAVLSAAPEHFALAGFSMGGCVALEIMARAPRRVYRLALLSTSAAGLPANVREHYGQWITRIETTGLAQYLADAFPRYVAPERAHDQALWETFSAMGKDLGAAVAVRQMRALLGYCGFRGDLRSVACPTVLICGAQDQRTPVEVHEQLARQIIAAELTVVAGSGHFTPLEAPAVVAAALHQWLRRSDRG
jgi:pimeloyl-ACP methyl ester carboxylesterase